MTKIEIDDIGEVLLRPLSNSKSIKVHVKPFRQIFVTYPKSLNIADIIRFVRTRKDEIFDLKKRCKMVEKDSKNIFEIMKNADTKEAIKSLLGRVDNLSKKFNLPYNDVTIRKQKTRWGSCSTKNNLSLNYGLCFIPEYLRDYVIIHELLHTKIKNHSKEFWDTLEKLFPGAKEYKEQLKQYTMPYIG